MRPRTGLLRLSLFALALTLAIPASAAADENPSRKDIQMVSPALKRQVSYWIVRLETSISGQRLSIAHHAGHPHMGHDATNYQPAWRQ
jgi:hypothetical protein